MSIPDPPEKEPDEESRIVVNTEETLVEKFKNMTLFYYKVLSELAGAIYDISVENKNLKTEIEKLKSENEHMKTVIGITEIGGSDEER